MKGTLGWAFSAWLALIALQTLSTNGASGRVSGAFTELSALVDRVLDPSIPAIPDRRTVKPAAAAAQPAAAAAQPATPRLPPASSGGGGGGSMRPTQ